MSLENGRRRWTWLLVLLLTGGMFATAGEVELDMDPDDPDPDEGKEVGDNWNPTYVCESEEGDSVMDLLLCMAGGMAEAESACIPAPILGGDGTVLQETPGLGNCNADPEAREDWLLTFISPFGFRIVPILATNPEPEVERLMLWENHDSILGVRLKVNRPSMVARIGIFVEKPSHQGGTITLRVDDSTITVDTTPLKKASEVTAAVVYKLETLDVNQDLEYDLDVVLFGGYIHVMKDLPNQVGITEVHYHSDDPGIVSSDVALLPIDETGLMPEPLQ